MSLMQETVREYAPQPEITAGRSLTVLPLNNEQESEVFAFLAERPLHTVIMAGMIRDNGLVSELNRGTFYACRNRRGEIEGVALIGHTTMVEAREPAALAAFACFARYNPSAYMVLGEMSAVERFWNYFAWPGLRKKSLSAPHRASRELLMEQREAVEIGEPVGDLRLATPEDLPVLLPVYAWMAFEGSSNNPLEADPEGFQRRWANRIDKKRVWVLIENERLIFNACIMAETEGCAYLEGIYVNPEERGKGYGSRCLSQLGRNLRLAVADETIESTARTRSLCLLVDEQNLGVQAFFEKAGYKQIGYYDTLFLSRKI